jgi:hypothetical protein
VELYLIWWRLKILIVFLMTFQNLKYFLLSDKLIEEVVEEFFFECIQEGYDIKEVENVLS